MFSQEWAAVRSPPASCSPVWCPCASDRGFAGFRGTWTCPGNGICYKQAPRQNFVLVRGLRQCRQAQAGWASSCPRSQGDLRGTGSTSGDKWLQGSPCLVPQHVALEGLCSSKVFIWANGISIWVKTDSGINKDNKFSLSVANNKKKARQGGKNRNRRVEINLFPVPSFVVLYQGKNNPA